MADVVSKWMITICRKWQSAVIEVEVGLWMGYDRQDPTRGEIGMRVSLDDFLKAVVQEAGNPALWLTKGTLEQKLREAAGRAVQGIKDETVKLV